MFEACDYTAGRGNTPVLRMNYTILQYDNTDQKALFYFKSSQQTYIKTHLRNFIFKQ